MPRRENSSKRRAPYRTPRDQILIVCGGKRTEPDYFDGLKRARQTAESIAEPHNLRVLIEPDIRELDHGELEGLTFNQIKDNYPDFISRWRTTPAEIQVPGGERLDDVAERAWQALNRIAGQHGVGK